MNWEAVGAVGEIVSAVMVLVTLLFLSNQIRQSNKIAQGQAMRDVIGQFNESMQRWADTTETIPIVQRGFSDYDGLSSAEKAHFSIRLAPMINQFDLMLRLHRSGQFPTDLLDDFASICISVITTPGGKQYWREASGTFGESVVEHLDTLISENRTRKPATELVSHWFLNDL